MLKKDFLDQILGMWGLFVGKCLSPVPWENRVALHLQGESRVEIAGLGTPFHRQTLCHMQCPGSCMVVGQIVYGQNGKLCALTISRPPPGVGTHIRGQVGHGESWKCSSCRLRHAQKAS